MLVMIGCEDQMTTSGDQNSPEVNTSVHSDLNYDQSNAAYNNKRNFRENLSGENENPSAETRTRGEAIIQLNKDEASFAFKLIAANIENITQAHIHCSSADVNGPIVVFLFSNEPPATLIPGRFDGVLTEDERTNDDIIPRGDSEVCPGSIANIDELISKMRSDEAYLNVHTTQNPPGEIRGQIF